MLDVMERGEVLMFLTSDTNLRMYSLNYMSVCMYVRTQMCVRE